ncbi:hypothetical protein CAEBREN_01364 [Caenorhabditis brenneri]|uniref:Uncharacterized protein n=1 Tax=Caenorhabditis brenneri TaxID=135651 RepID=G0NYH9_CAEBE|nr:hypothetical protein CAEBREN_01364 [Caenorhabditis brenneri]
MLGKWAEMRVDDKNSVREPIRIVRPYFETRAIAGLAEKQRHERGRNSSPDIKNEYNMDESSPRSSRHRSRSNDARTRNNSFERHISIRFNDSSSPNRINKYDEGSSYAHTNSSYNEMRRSDVESSEYSGSRMNAFPHNNHRRRSQSAERNISHHSTDNGYLQDENTENRGNFSQPPGLSSNSRLVEKGNYNQSNSFEVEKPRVASKTEQEKQILILKQRLSRMSQLVLSLTTDESVSMPMKMWNVEEYEDLIELAKKPV